jgi:gamma-glutamylcysteine synthetase
MLSGNDTVIAITLRQMEYINFMKIERDELREINQTLRSAMNVMQMQESLQTRVIESLRNETDLSGRIAAGYTAISDRTDGELAKSIRQSGRYKGQRNLFIGSTGILAVVLIVLCI